MKPDLEQIKIDEIPGAEVPGDKIRKPGKKQRPVPISQSDMFHPDKITYGKLPQDQEELIK